MIEVLGVELPIIQAPMAGVSTPALAAAVSNAGGLGSLGVGASTVAQARQAIAKTQALTERPFNVNVFCHEPARRNEEREAGWLKHLAPLFEEFGTDVPTGLDEIYKTFITDEKAFRMLLDARPAIVSFHFGLPAADKIAAFREAGTKMLASATNLVDALAIEAAGIDGIVAQGIEAGGHRGVFDTEAFDERLSTSVLVRLLVTKTSLPVIAAGGIMDGAGVRATLDLGAVAAQLGTAFVLCPESAANAGYRENLKSERAAVTRLTSALSGRPARGIVNRFIELCEAAGSPLSAAYPVSYDAAKQLNAAAVKQGSHEFAAHWAGQGAALARELPAAKLVETLAHELQAAGH
ncbi:2-nitropropane dioxygenase [Brucella pseudogrignonensis]|uniref:NAD(P)H-dependent flavin oxidoreductase n=1 Tax=Brucella pseudogrignonensis TaxID=419475 RepID=UPI0007DA5EBD|nr:nitronate monooxygenase [Brucella pseudogrignonensis]ANG98789.1 2-nitropropane dioxygenase [Brucella pseudogrignonensis]